MSIITLTLRSHGSFRALSGILADRVISSVSCGIYYTNKDGFFSAHKGVFILFSHRLSVVFRKVGRQRREGNARCSQIQPFRLRSGLSYNSTRNLGSLPRMYKMYAFREIVNPFLVSFSDSTVNKRWHIFGFR